MNLLLTRHPRPTCTPGILEANGIFLCYTMEDSEGPNQEDYAIPCGTYEIAVTFSKRFQMPMPILLDVPGRTGIRFHWGNTEADTSGCILVGRVQRDDWIGESRLAYTDFFYRISKVIKSEKVKVTIQHEVMGVPV